MFMHARSVARLCQVGGIAAIVLAPIPFLTLFYRLATTKVLRVPQERFAYDDAYWSTFLWLAAVGIVFGCALLAFGRRFRSKRLEVLL